MILNMFLIAFLFWMQRGDNDISQLYIILITLNAGFLTVGIGIIIWIFSHSIDISAFGICALIHIVIAISAYLSSYIYTGLLASPNAKPKVIYEASLVMQAVMYCLMTGLVWYWLLASYPTR